MAFGRTLRVHAHGGGACWLTFDELCRPADGEVAKGAADYLALAKAAPCLFLSGVPVLSKSTRNEARRFVMLIDALYEARVQLHMAADAPPMGIIAPLLEAAGRALLRHASGVGRRFA